MLETRFQQSVAINKWWQPGEKVLVAVSAGVDSTVLFHLLHHLPISLKPQIIVAHVDHQLRESSTEESQFVASVCQKRQVPFFNKVWKDGAMVTTNMEQAARDVRYGFFSEVMEQEGIRCLLTAHHEDDQIETMMMRLVGGSRLKGLIGMSETRDFSLGQLIRPLLPYKKSDLYEYAKRHELLFFEDESNQETSYARNRMRHVYLPQLRQENPQLNEQLLSLREELQAAQKIVVARVTPLYEESIHLSSRGVIIRQSLFETYSEAEQHFILTHLVEELHEVYGLVIGKKQQELIQKALVSEQPNVSFPLKGDWFFTRSYHEASLRQEKSQTVKNSSHVLKANEGVRVSSSEWFGLFEADQVVLPEELSQFKRLDYDFVVGQKEQLLIRRPQPGDRIVLNDKGQHKKISRYFIDEKIPREKRQMSWVIEDSLGTVKWLVPFRESYLSIRDETDKIHYKLVYLYLKDE
ncbi:tRNA lysidine(34) synthetase TilS [Vagococcus sp. DIV0080]|uniref:tRNA(Ile)-lysidine synthase n=1 Tax=Candidatus Vagococcus giribetii TaxID=2230876 RepID=A0ABS3HQF3_9ENTE|nr:tRNA lysidine(34) synthetase TilS [Vagococcus sp. DIV0080]